MSLVTIALADDHPIVRHGLRMLLGAETDFKVVSEAADGLLVLEMVQRHQPSVLILDIMLPGMNGLEIVRQIDRYAPQTRCLMLSMHGNEAYMLEAMHNGAKGYVLKSAGAQTLIDAVRIVATGRLYLSPPFSERAIESFMQPLNTSHLDVYHTLTRREHEIFQLMAKGYKNAEISVRLSISVRTVEVHRTRIMQKLDLASTRDIIYFALQRGILTVEDPEWENSSLT